MESYLDECSFCGLKRSSGEATFCTSCGRPLLQPTAVRSMDLGQTTANYDPYHPDWKPWREPSVMKKRPKRKKNDTFYNKNVWGKSAPLRPLPKLQTAEITSSDTSSAPDSAAGELVFSDYHEFGGVRFRGFTWKKPLGRDMIRRRQKREKISDEPYGITYSSVNKKILYQYEVTDLCSIQTPFWTPM